MSKRTVLTAIILVSTGIIFGAVLVSSFSGSNLSFADSNTRFNSEAPFTPSADAASLNQTFRDVSEIVTPQVVYISVKTRAPRNPHSFFNWPFRQQPDGEEDENYRTGTGSGIIITEDGYIMTNRHVVEDAIEEGITVTLNDNREYIARLVGEDENTDIAVIKIDEQDLAAASLGNSDEVRTGEWVLAVGNPLGLTSTVTAGIVSAISRNIGIMRDRRGFGIENFIQTDAAINPGNSGGALVNLQGQVIGVNTAIAGAMQGTYMGFAVPINLAKVVAKALIRDGRFVRGYIGIRINDIDAKTAEALGMDVYKGVLVASLVEDGAGEKAGIESGDAIVEVDGRPVESANQLQARVGMKHPGEAVELKIWRDGRYITKSVTLQGQEGEESVAEAKADDASKEIETAEPVSYKDIGFTVKPLDVRERKTFDRKTGVLVSSVKRPSKAFESGLQQGTVIFEAIRKGQRVPIETLADFKEFVADLNDGESVLFRYQTPNGDGGFVPLKAPIK
ncbi:MAG: trypsin-like peptidase domain-containing protein [Bacteroidota bacterium]|nr:trypsin-like peptidase domain-containing protein [Bacteroidota bacterium]